MINISFMKLYQRNHGTWYIRLSGGKRLSLKTKDKTVAKRLYNRTKREFLLGNIIQIDKDKNVLLKDFIKEYLEYSKTHKSKETAEREFYFFKSLIEHIGNIPLKLITVKQIDNFHTSLILKGRKPAGINITIRHLKSAFNKAVSWGYLLNNPYKKISQIKEDKQPPRFLSVKEIETIMDAIKHDQDFHDLITCYLLTGARRSELCYLMKTDVDFINAIINIRKSKTGWRAIPMNETVMEIMQRRCRGEGRVFPKWQPHSITYRWIRLMKRLGIKSRLHDLRHSTASYLVMMGVDIRTVQEILGHTNITTTQIYSHLTKDHVRSAMSKLGKWHKNGTAGSLRIVTGCNDR